MLMMMMMMMVIMMLMMMMVMMMMMMMMMMMIMVMMIMVMMMVMMMMMMMMMMNGFLHLLFIVEVAHEHMAATDADLDENSKANWLNCLQLYNYHVGRYANSNN